MSRLERRVERLEGHRGGEDVTVVAVVPRDWPEVRQEREVRTAAIEQGAKEPFVPWIVPSDDAEGVSLQWIGDVGEMLDRIAREGRLITDRPPLRRSKIVSANRVQRDNAKLNATYRDMQ